jgi:hypothetical protein
MTKLGIATTSYINGDPVRDAYEFLEHAHALGANEDFSTLADFEKFKTPALNAIKLAVPIAEKYKIPLAMENHKGFTLEQQIAIFKSYSSEYFGACHGCRAVR